MEQIKIDMEFLTKRPLSYSSLKAFRKSPRHYVQYVAQPKEKTEEMLFGTLVECLTLEPEKFDLKYMVYEPFEKRSNEAKAKYAGLIDAAQAAGVTLINSGMVEDAKKCVVSLFDHDVSRQIIEAKKRVQVKMKWLHKETGLPMIGYVDFESKAFESNFIIDLKTARSADPEEFIRDASKLDYHLQVGSYMDGYPRTQFLFPNMAFLVVETDEPYNVSVMFCEPDYIARSMDEFNGTMKAFKYCIDNDQFHMGYDFRLMGTKQYFGMSIPGYNKQKFETINND